MNTMAISYVSLDIFFSYYQPTYTDIYAYNFSEIKTACINIKRVNSLKYLGITLNENIQMTHAIRLSLCIFPQVIWLVQSIILNINSLRKTHVKSTTPFSILAFNM